MRTLFILFILYLIPKALTAQWSEQNRYLDNMFAVETTNVQWFANASNQDLYYDLYSPNR